MSITSLVRRMLFVRQTEEETDEYEEDEGERVIIPNTHIYGCCEKRRTFIFVQQRGQKGRYNENHYAVLAIVMEDAGSKKTVMQVECPVYHPEEYMNDTEKRRCVIDDCVGIMLDGLLAKKNHHPKAPVRAGINNAGFEIRVCPGGRRPGNIGTTHAKDEEKDEKTQKEISTAHDILDKWVALLLDCV